MTDEHDRVSRSRAFIAHEGWIWLLISLVVGVVAARLGYTGVAGAMAVVIVFLALLFRDPARVVPPLPAVVYAPVDGRVTALQEVESGVSGPGWWRVQIRTSWLGAYTIRAPIEGTIQDIAAGAIEGQRPAGMCIRSEEGDDVLLAFPRQGRLRTPRAFVRYGERLGQGERFAYLRLAPLAEIYLAGSCRLCVAIGDPVRAGDTVIGELINA